MELQIIQSNLLSAYLQQFPKGLEEAFHQLTEAEISTDSFSFYTSVSSVYSSKIEGENIELDSYVKHRRFGIEFLPDYTKKIDDLYDAYVFAQNNPLNEGNIAKVHQLLSKHIVAQHMQGRLRTQNMYVSTPDGRIEYVTASPFAVAGEIGKLHNDIDTLLKTNLLLPEVFYFAAMIHLVFLKIHPWNDGNGRSARLIEKWFLAQHLGKKAWFVQSEKHYYQNHDTYYRNIRALGLEYEQLDYGKALPFLLMLPEAINT